MAGAHKEEMKNVVVKRWVRKGQKDAGEGSSQSKRGEVDHKELQFGTLPGLAKEKEWFGDSFPFWQEDKVLNPVFLPLFE